MTDTYGLECVIQDLVEALNNLSETMQSKSACDELKEHIPFDYGYEAVLLGCLMLDNDAFDVIAERVSACHFATARHQNIFGAMKRIHDNKKPLDTLMVYEELEKSGKADPNMEAYLFDLAKDAPGEALPHLSTIAKVIWVDSQNRKRMEKEKRKDPCYGGEG